MKDTRTKAEEFLDKYIVSEDDWLNQQKDVILKLMTDFAEDILKEAIFKPDEFKWLYEESLQKEPTTEEVEEFINSYYELNESIKIIHSAGMRRMLTFLNGGYDKTDKGYVRNFKELK